MGGTPLAIWLGGCPRHPPNTERNVMMKSTLLATLVAATLPAVAFAAPTFQPAVAPTVAADEAKAPAIDAPGNVDEGLVLVREGGSRRGRDRGRP